MLKYCLQCTPIQMKKNLVLFKWQKKNIDVKVVNRERNRERERERETKRERERKEREEDLEE